MKTVLLIVVVVFTLGLMSGAYFVVTLPETSGAKPAVPSRHAKLAP